MKDTLDRFTVDAFAPGLSCPVCGGLLAVPRTGRPPVYCANACKMRAYRVRAAVTKRQRPSETVTEHAAYGVGGS